MDYKNNIFILRNIHKSNDEELIDYTFEKILRKIFNYYKENRNKEIYNIDNCYKKYFPNLYLDLLEIYNLSDLTKLINRKNNCNKIEYFQHFGNKNIPETSCSNALEGLLHHGC